MKSANIALLQSSVEQSSTLNYQQYRLTDHFCVDQNAKSYITLTDSIFKQPNFWLTDFIATLTHRWTGDKTWLRKDAMLPYA